MGKKAQNMPHPHKRISQNMPGQTSKEEGESGNYIFFELEDRIRIAMGIIFGPEGRGGVTKWITAGKCPFIFRSQ